MTQATATFETDATSVLADCRAALSGVVNALPGAVQRPQDLARTLGIDKKLAWRIMNVIQSTDVFEAAQHLPGKSGVRIFLNAAGKLGAPEEVMGSVVEALEGYQRLVKVHAGDKASLELMLSSHVRQGRQRIDLEQRRAAFRANSYIWGIQTKTLFRTYLLHPSDDGDLFDFVSLRGLVDLRRIRANTPWVIHKTKVVDDDGQPRRSVWPELLDPSAGDEDDPEAVPWLPRFCSTPLPQVRRLAVGGSHVHYEIMSDSVGNTGLSTCILGSAVRSAAPRYCEPNNDCVELVVRAHLPAERLMFDQIVHRDLFGDHEPKLTVYGELTGETPPRSMDAARQELPVVESAMFIGEGPAAMHATGIPRYTEIMEFAFQQMGWDARDFLVYRVEMQYPPIPTAIVLGTPLPEAGTE